MHRADRLFRIAQLIRGRRLTTAAFLAERLSVSQRSIYRDIVSLQAQGVPIEGEAGVGYRMRRGFDLPPLMFSSSEAQALVASVRLAQSRIDTELAARADDALTKILGVLPPADRIAAERLSLYAFPNGPDQATRMRLTQLRSATDAKFKVRLDYLDLNDAPSLRLVRPLACFFWGEVWTLAAWCELREDFRHFRVDRIRSLDVLETRFRDEPGCSLNDLFRRYECEDSA